jgi:hypothetical protein
MSDETLAPGLSDEQAAEHAFSLERRGSYEAAIAVHDELLTQLVVGMDLPGFDGESLVVE